MKVYVVYESIPVILGTTTVSSYEQLRFIGLTRASAQGFRDANNHYDSIIGTWEVTQ